MRIVRFDHRGKAVCGLVEGESIVPLAAAPWETGGKPERAGAPVERRSAALLVPVVPSKILCVGRNYRAHAAELGQEVPEKPLIFLKPPSSLLPHRGTVLLPPESARVDHEGELAVVIGRRGRRLSREEAARAVFGYTCALDITARDLQKTDGQWWRAKGFDTFCPLGPAVETDVDPSDLLLETLVDDVVKQSGRTSGDGLRRPDARGVGVARHDPDAGRRAPDGHAGRGLAPLARADRRGPDRRRRDPLGPGREGRVTG